MTARMGLIVSSAMATGALSGLLYLQYTEREYNKASEQADQSAEKAKQNELEAEEARVKAKAAEEAQEKARLEAEAKRLEMEAEKERAKEKQAEAEKARLDAEEERGLGWFQWTLIAAAMVVFGWFVWSYVIKDDEASLYPPGTLLPPRLERYKWRTGQAWILLRDPQTKEPLQDPVTKDFVYAAAKYHGDPTKLENYFITKAHSIAGTHSATGQRVYKSHLHPEGSYGNFILRPNLLREYGIPGKAYDVVAHAVGRDGNDYEYFDS